MCSHDSNSESVPLDKDIFGYFHWAAPDTRFSYWFGKTSVFFSPSVNNRQRPACGGLLDNGGVSHSPVPVFLQLPLDITASFTESTDPCSSMRVSVCVCARALCVWMWKVEGLSSCLPPTLSKNVPVWDGCHHICICVCPGGKSARRQQRFHFFINLITLLLFKLGRWDL